jgi:hypothetical protein
MIFGFYNNMSHHLSSSKQKLQQQKGLFIGNEFQTPQ